MTNDKKDEYPISPMHRHLKEVVWYQLAREQSGEMSRESGKVHRLKWLFQQKDFPCGACRSIEKVKFMVLPTGVYRSCENEGMTEKIDPIDEGELHSEAILLEDVVLTDNADAVAVIKRYHQEKIFLDEDSHISLPPYKLPKSAGKRPKIVG
jgi:hypothetical protein